MNTSPMQIEYSPVAEIGWTDNLRKGIWPKRMELWLLVVYFSIVIIRPWEKLIPELGDLHFERICVVLMFGLTLLCGRMASAAALQTGTYVTFLLVAWTTALTAFDPELSTPVLMGFLAMFLFYVFILSIVRTPYQLLFLVTCFLVILFVYQVKSQWEYFVHGAGTYRMGVRRLNGIEESFGHPNQFSFSVVCTFPFWYMLYRIKDVLTKEWPRFWQKNFTRFLWIYMAVSCASVLLTYSRAGTLGLVGAFLLMALRRGKFMQQLKQMFAIGFVCFFVFFFLPQDIQYRIQSIWDDSVEIKAGMKGANTSADGRWEGLVAGMEMFEDRPWLGVGIGNFKAYRVAKGDGVFLSAHNLPGEILGEIGVIGTVSFAMVVGVFWMYWRPIGRFARNSGHPTVAAMHELALACRDCVIILAYASITQHTLQRYHWFLIGALSVLAFRFARAAVQDEERLLTQEHLAPAHE